MHDVAYQSVFYGKAYSLPPMRLSIAGGTLLGATASSEADCRILLAEHINLERSSPHNGSFLFFIAFLSDNFTNYYQSLSHCDTNAMRFSVQILPLAAALWLGGFASAQDPNCAPGGNFDLSKFNLQLPVGTSSNPNSPRTISSGDLQGCGGWSDRSYFFTSSSGSLIMKV